MLSIVTINRNNAIGLKATVDSLRTQSCQDFEWICVDGLSTDESVKIAFDFRRQDDSVLTEADTGIYNAMNKGARLATRRMVLFLNSGDILYDSSAVHRIKQKCIDPTDLAMFGFEIRGMLRYPRGLWWRYWSMPTSHQAIAYSREILLKNPFNEEYRFAADFDQFLRITREPASISSSREIVVTNESYGSDLSLSKVLDEYRRSLIENGCPRIWANLVHFVKRHYLKRALAL